MSGHEIPPCGILIDREGRWFYQGQEMVRRDFIRLFYRNMERDGSGRYLITLAGDRCYLDVEDAPYVVWRTVKKGEEPGTRHFMLHLSDDSREELVPETLYVGRDHVLYCRVRGGDFPARFSRPAYYQLAEFIEEKDGDFVLPAKGMRYPIRQLLPLP